MLDTTTPLIAANTVRSGIFMLIALFVVAVASVLGSTVTSPMIPTWYAALNKPWFNPPNWLFPIAWTTLFLLMAFGFWRVLRQVDGGRPRNLAILAFLAQIVVNISWSYAFFGAQSPFAGIFVAVALVAAVAAMLFAFRRIDRLAGNLQWPYLAWVSFALVLNIAIWRIN